jgi:hypothetical protein
MTGENLFNKTTFDMLTHHADQTSIFNGLRSLKSNGIMTEENCRAIAQSTRPQAVSEAFNMLSLRNILSDDNRAVLLRHIDPKQLAAAMSKLHQNGLLTDNTRRDITEVSSPLTYAKIIIVLKKADILNPENLQSINAHGLNDFFVEILYHLNNATILTQANFTRLLSIPRTTTGVDYYIDNLFKDMPAHELRNNFTRIMDYLLTGAAQQFPRRLLQLRNEYRRLRQRPGGLNGEQSTHTASVHATTDLTAWLISTENHSKRSAHPTSFAPIKDALQALAPTATMTADKIRTALTCLDRLDRSPVTIRLNSAQKQRSLAFIKSELVGDPRIAALIPALEQDQHRETELTLLEFIMWIYQDMSTHPRGDYMEALVETLFEIQRGYNANDSGQDDGNARDLSICFGGTANKCCERLKGLSPLIQFIFTNEESISFKITPLLLSALLRHVETLYSAAQTRDRQAQERFCALINDLKNPDKVSDIYESLFSEEQLMPLLAEEFKAYILLTGQTTMIKTVIGKFLANALPYLPHIDIAAGPGTIYSADFLKAFARFDAAKLTMEAGLGAIQTVPAGVSAGLSQQGLFSIPAVSAEDAEGLNASPKP